METRPNLFLEITDLWLDWIGNFEKIFIGQPCKPNSFEGGDLLQKCVFNIGRVLKIKYRKFHRNIANTSSICQGNKSHLEFAVSQCPCSIERWSWCFGQTEIRSVCLIARLATEPPAECGVAMPVSEARQQVSPDLRVVVAGSLRAPERIRPCDPPIAESMHAFASVPTAAAKSDTPVASALVEGRLAGQFSRQDRSAVLRMRSTASRGTPLRHASYRSGNGLTIAARCEALRLES